jgi:hypothetical protein
MKISLRPLKRVLKTAMSRYRYKDALRIEDTLYNRLQELLAKHHPDIKVKLHRWQGTILHDVYWGGSFSVLVYLDGTCCCGMSFDLIGRYLIISQIHGVGLNQCRYRPMRRWWEVTLVRAAHDLGFRTLLIRADHANSWPNATTEIRQRLVRRLDATAQALGMTTRGAYWVWNEEVDQESHSRQDGFRLGPIGGFSPADASRSRPAVLAQLDRK